MHAEHDSEDPRTFDERLEVEIVRAVRPKRVQTPKKNKGDNFWGPENEREAFAFPRLPGRRRVYVCAFVASSTPPAHIFARTVTILHCQL